MNYNETLKYITSTPKFSKTPGNAEFSRLLEHLGNPQNSLRFIHVAGTNGKGSVCAMTALALQAAGYKTGLYVSPFINVFNERIQINGNYIPDTALAQIATEVKNAVCAANVDISEFAQITAIAFLYFARENCDYVVLETGLGGRLDATNVITTPAACVITKIGLDHTELLGDTIEKIAAEKCGIIKDGIPVITCANQDSGALSVIRSECEKHRSALFTADDNLNVTTGMRGAYQKYNAAVCMSVCKVLGISSEAAEYGVRHAFCPARFEFLRENLIIDGGHNPDAVSALIPSLKALGKPVTLVIAMMKDKDFQTVCKMLADIAQNVIVTQLNIPRCIEAERLAQEFPVCVTEPDCKKAVEKALSINKNGVVCVCGSLYLASEVRKHYSQSKYI